MAKFRVVSQKRFIKGLNAGTGILTQPPSTITRVSNMGFTQRGSLQTLNGSAIVGQLVTPYTQSSVVGTYANLVSGSYPYYPELSSTVGYALPNITAITVTPSGATSNPAGSYTFAIIATNGSQHSDPAQGQVTVIPSAAFGSIAFVWAADSAATAYAVYYLPGGPGATLAVLLASPGSNSYTFSGTLPVTPLVALPLGNNSFLYQLQIGYVTPPGKQVLFAATSTTFPGVIPQPAQLSPGDPNFQFQTGSQSTFTFTGGSITELSTFQIGNGTNTQTSPPLGGFPALALSGQTVTVQAVITGAYSLITPGATATVSAVYQYSINSGSTWNTFYTFTATNDQGPVPGGIPVTFTVSNLTNLSDLQFQIVETATVTGSGNATVNGGLNYTLPSGVIVSVVTGSSFTPYGGIAGFIDPIPQILQFAGLTPSTQAPEVLSILILGNGYAPQSCNPTNLASTTCTPLANTFQSTYPGWQATVDWIAGSTIGVTVGGKDYSFSATQGGVSGGTIPTFSATLGSTVDDGQVIWQNIGTLTTPVAPRGAAHGIVYAGSLWLYNTSPETTTDQLDGPTCLKMSDSNNPSSWNPVNIAFLGKDDGTQGTGLATFTIAEVGIAPTQSIVCFKEYSTYQVLGIFGAPDFQITQAQTDLGCIAARSIQFLAGRGIMRLTHLGFAIFSGVKDTLVSEEIRPYLFGGIQLNADITGIDFSFVYLARAVEISNPPMYACACPLAGANGLLTRLFIYDLVLKAWTIMDLPWAITALMQARTGEGTPLALGFRGDGTGALERFFAGDPSWDAVSLVSMLPASAIPIQWNFTSVYVYEEGSSSRVFYREVVIRGYSSAQVASAVTVTLLIDGNLGQTYQTYLEPQPFSGQFELSVDLMFTAQIVTFNIAGTGVVTIDGCDWKVSPKPGGRLVIG